MKKFLKLLKVVILLPIFPAFGVEGGEGSTSGGEGNSAGENGGNSGEGDKNSSGGNNGNSGGKSANEGDDKKFTQKDVDKMITDRLKRQQKKFDDEIEKFKKQFAPEGEGNTGAQGGQGQVSEETLKAQAALTSANKRLVDATATTEAIKLGVDPKYVTDAVKLADLSKVEVKEDGTMDIKPISTALAAVLERVPALKTSTETSGGFRVGGSGQQGNGQQGNGWGNNSNNNNSNNQQQARRWNKWR